MATTRASSACVRGAEVPARQPQELRVRALLGLDLVEPDVRRVPGLRRLPELGVDPLDLGEHALRLRPLVGERRIRGGRAGREQRSRGENDDESEKERRSRSSGRRGVGHRGRRAGDETPGPRYKVGRLARLADSRNRAASRKAGLRGLLRLRTKSGPVLVSRAVHGRNRRLAVALMVAAVAAFCGFALPASGAESSDEADRLRRADEALAARSRAAVLELYALQAQVRRADARARRDAVARHGARARAGLGRRDAADRAAVRRRGPSRPRGAPPRAVRAGRHRPDRGDPLLGLARGRAGDDRRPRLRRPAGPDADRADARRASPARPAAAAARGARRGGSPPPPATRRRVQRHSRHARPSAARSSTPSPASAGSTPSRSPRSSRRPSAADARSETLTSPEAGGTALLDAVPAGVAPAPHEPAVVSIAALRRADAGRLRHRLRDPWAHRERPADRAGASPPSIRP